MRHHRSLAAIALFGVVALISGCLGSDDSPVAADGTDPAEESAIESVAFEEMSEFTEIDVRYWEDPDEGASLAPINTHRWKRELLSLDKTVEIVIEKPDGEPATADVTVSAEATGLLHLLACSADSLEHLTKDFDDAGSRRMFFEQVRLNRLTARHRGWKLAALSGVDIASANTTRTINSVRIQSGDLDETITNVTDLVRIEDLLRIPAGSEVAITVDTGDASDQVFLHVRHRHRRAQLESNDDGTFSGKFWTGDRAGPRHIVVDVLSEGTLLDDEAPYDNRAWGYTYLVKKDGDDGSDVPDLP